MDTRNLTPLTDTETFHEDQGEEVVMASFARKLEEDRAKLVTALEAIANGRADRCMVQHEDLWEWMRDRARDALRSLDEEV